MLRSFAMRSPTTDLQIRGIPTKLRDRLRRKAESNGKSMSEYLIGIIERDVDTLTMDEWIALVRRHPPAKLGVSAAELLHEAYDEEEARWDERFGFDKGQ